MFRLVLLLTLTLSAKGGEPTYHQPLAHLKAEEIKEMRITAMDRLGKPGKSRVIPDKEFIRKLIASMTPKDYPQLGKDGLGMSTPGTLLKVELIGTEARPVAIIDMLGAWNLLQTRVPGMRESVTGSNRLLCEHLMKQFETLDPEAHAEAATRYKEHISGKSPRELHEELGNR